MPGKDYKPQIDGLRALAVLPVIFFHAGFEIFKGGFVGVDVFFVISGYLITTIIINDLSKNKFKLSNFYLRRSRRILPALYTVTLICIPISIFLMSNEELKYFSEQIFSVVFFISNFFFWKNTGYFNPNSDLQPLLHTWSLSVEEQFYIFFPIFLIFVWKFLRKKIVFLLILIILLSLILAQVGGNFKYQNLSIDPPFFLLPFEFFWQAGSANFYLPFGRAWELLFGSLAAIYTNKHNSKVKGNDLLSLIGFCFIIFSIFIFSEDLQYPSIYTLLPVTGTILIIINSNNSTIVYKFLSFKPLVFTGLISYSLYLWHQPILAFSRLYFGVNLSIFGLIFCLFSSLIISYFSWKYIEKPFRDQKIINNRQAIKYLLLFSIFIVFSTSLIYTQKIKSLKPSLPQSLEETMKISESNDCLDIEGSHIDNVKKWYCEIGEKKEQKIKFIVTGDSHSSAMRPAFEEIGSKKKIKGIMTGFSGCPPLLGVQSIRINIHKRNCKLLNEKVFKYVKENKIKKVFLVSRWTYYTDGDYYGKSFHHISKDNFLFSNKKKSRKAFKYALEYTMKRYNDIGVEVIFVHQPPMQLYNPMFIYINSFNFSKKTIDKEKLENLSVDYDKHMNFQKFVRENINLLKNKKYKFKEINLDNFFCDTNKCMIGTKKGSYYGDDDHLSIYGAVKIQNIIGKYLD